MVKGLDRFKEQFAPFMGQYMLIGGTACMVALNETGRNFRATKDIDIVLSIEALDSNFVKAFWQFIQEGGYQNRQRSTGKKLFYRFYAPKDPTFPEMLELFSRKPDAIRLSEGGHLTPIPIDDAISSLSAILLNEDYYQFVHEGKREIGGLSLVSPDHLIPLKARAWVDLSGQLAAGGAVDKKDIRKHKNDVIRLYPLLPISSHVSLPPSVKQDMRTFLEGIQGDSHIDLKDLEIKNIPFAEIIRNLRQVYGL